MDDALRCHSANQRRGFFSELRRIIPFFAQNGLEPFAFGDVPHHADKKDGPASFLHSGLSPPFRYLDFADCQLHGE